MKSYIFFHTFLSIFTHFCAHFFRVRVICNANYSMFPYSRDSFLCIFRYYFECGIRICIQFLSTPFSLKVISVRVWKATYAFIFFAILQNHMRIFKYKYIFWKMVVYSSREVRSDTAIARRMAPTAKLCDEPFRSYEPFKIIFDLFSGIFSRVFSGYAQLWTAITHIYLIPGTRSHTFSESSLNAELKYVIIFSIECIV